MRERDADSPDTPEDYIVEHATTALACDPRVGALDIAIAVEQSRLIARGTVETAERKQAILVVLTELFPDHEVTVDVVVTQTPGGAPAVEELP